ncbi:MAG: hypothetical protein FJY55_06250 [Betaproteobacteria bacterium]|nr:hypothetical protein [Betaproteobacteria bacterium]
MLQCGGKEQRASIDRLYHGLDQRARKRRGFGADPQMILRFTRAWTGTDEAVAKPDGREAAIQRRDLRLDEQAVNDNDHAVFTPLVSARASAARFKRRPMWWFSSPPGDARTPGITESILGNSTT